MLGYYLGWGMKKEAWVTVVSGNIKVETNLKLCARDREWVKCWPCCM